MQAALAIAALWLVAVVIGSATASPLAGTVVAILPPIGLALLAYALLAGSGSGRALPLDAVDTRLAVAHEQVALLESALARIGTAATGTAEQVRDMASMAATEMPVLVDQAATLENAAQRITASGATTSQATAAMMAALPDIARTVATVGDTLRDVSADTATQLRAVETMLAAVQARNHDAAVQADTAIANMSALLVRIDEASSRNTTTLSKRAYALDAAIDGVLERSAAVVGQITEQIDGQMRGFAFGIDATHKQMAMFGDDGARLFNQRVDLLLKTSAQLKTEFDTHDADAARLHAAVGEQIDDMQRRFAALDQAGNESVGEIASRLIIFQDRLAGLQTQLEGSQAALAGMDEQSGKLTASATDIHALLAGQLAEARESMRAFDGEALRLREAVTVLSTSVQDNVGVIQGAAAAFGAEREAVAGLAARLESHFDTARATLADIREGSSAATTEAAATLATELARVKTTAADAAMAMQANLAIVVDDAMAALRLAAENGSDAAFGAPVRAQLAAIEDATARAAESGQDLSRRLAGHMLNLVEAVSAAEARIDNVETRFAVRERNSLTAQSVRILAQLDAALVDVARLLVLPVGEDDWARYLAGDRGAFARAVVPLLDRGMSRRLARLFAQDDDFRATASAYMQSFELLINRLLGDRDGENLAAAMVSSDIGKIYVAISEAADRLPPSRV